MKLLYRGFDVEGEDRAWYLDRRARREAWPRSRATRMRCRTLTHIRGAT
jgi:hypothetical protein